MFPLVEVPSGDADKGLGNGKTQYFLPVWLQKDFGKWTIYGGGGYWINPGTGNKNWWFSEFSCNILSPRPFISAAKSFTRPPIQSAAGTAQASILGGACL
jgi:hypothetical protein